MANEIKITTENDFNPNHFAIGANHESSNDKKSCFRYFCRLLTSSLTLRLQNTYIRIGKIHKYINTQNMPRYTYKYICVYI